MRIAVIGAGISGLVSAYLLSRSHDVTVFEAGARAGGHTNTIDVALDGTLHHVDTGFIVFNRPNYPLFVRLLEQLDVAVQPTEMSFSVQSEADGLEWCGSGVDGFFAQRRNLLRPAHWRLLREILRFNREAPHMLEEEEGTFTLREYLEREGYAQALRDLYIVPMASALWSADPRTVLEFPAHYFVRFFENHGFFRLQGRPDWLAIRGGSQRYVEKLTAGFRERIRVRTPVLGVRRDESGVEVETEIHGRERFDAVVLTVHSDQALRMLRDPTTAECDVLGAIPYQPNEAVLHTDAAVMPRSKRAWSSWNYHVPAGSSPTSTVTYDMNRLQSLPAEPPFFVTLNRTAGIDPARILRRIQYHHPVYTPATRAAQKRWDEINGVRHTWYGGAYWGWGFHEDGVRSAVRICEQFGEVLGMKPPPIRHSAVYEGSVRHRRHAPVRNHFRYGLYMLYLDLEELPRLFERRGPWALGRRSLAWFKRADYLGPKHVPLATAVRDLVEGQTGERPSGPVRMLTQVRTLGYVFNPVTFYYCFDAADTRVETIVTHITNTPWGERFAYVHTRSAAGTTGRRKRFRFAKAFHVSPFMRMAQDYDWRFGEPGERLWVHMETAQDGIRMLDATLALERRPWSRRTLRRVLLRHPLMTFQVIAAIHVQALRLWWKRAPFFAHPRRSRGSDHDPVATSSRPGDSPPEGRSASGPQSGAESSEAPERRQPVRS